jgi:hypothetical protein
VLDRPSVKTCWSGPDGMPLDRVGNELDRFQGRLLEDQGQSFRGSGDAAPIFKVARANQDDRSGCGGPAHILLTTERHTWAQNDT